MMGERQWGRDKRRWAQEAPQNIVKWIKAIKKEQLRRGEQN